MACFVTCMTVTHVPAQCAAKTLSMCVIFEQVCCTRVCDPISFARGLACHRRVKKLPTRAALSKSRMVNGLLAIMFCLPQEAQNMRSTCVYTHTSSAKSKRPRCPVKRTEAHRPLRFTGTGTSESDISGKVSSINRNMRAHPTRLRACGCTTAFVHASHPARQLRYVRFTESNSSSCTHELNHLASDAGSSARGRTLADHWGSRAAAHPPAASVAGLPMAPECVIIAASALSMLASMQGQHNRSK